MTTVPCDGCLQPVFASANPCMACCRARADAAMAGGVCQCRRSMRRERSAGPTLGGRRWIACDRCLGVVGPLPDAPRHGVRASLDGEP